MKSIIRRSHDSVELVVDTRVYDQQVIAKVLYWISEAYVIEWSENKGNAIIVLRSKTSYLSDADFELLANRLSQDFIDFKTRQIVDNQTRTIRELLLVKAFASTDEFDQPSLMQIPQAYE